MQQATDRAWWAALLAGQLLVETGIYKQIDPQYDTNDLETLARVRGWLMALVAGGHLPPVDRSTAGRALGWLGDERPGVGVKNGVPDIDWVEIEAGQFIMGSDKNKDQLALDKETPQFIYTITTGYQMSRYPITVAQYQAFVDAGGYHYAPYWREAAEQEIWRDGQLRCRTWSREKKEYVEEWTQGPAYYGPDYNAPNQPQVGISWYEALAFSRWLSDLIKTVVRLPTEAEWERAARHTDGRLYPWGNKFHPSYCNMYDTGIGIPSPVGAFPTSDAVCGVADMSGNLWDWCSTKWLEDYQNYAAQVDDAQAGDTPRMVRGGSFFVDQFNVRCAARYGYIPVNRGNGVGFRVVRAPGL